jgi:uncharacterized membrane protein YkgB
MEEDKELHIVNAVSFILGYTTGLYIGIRNPNLDFLFGVLVGVTVIITLSFIEYYIRKFLNKRKKVEMSISVKV